MQKLQVTSTKTKINSIKSLTVIYSYIHTICRTPSELTCRPTKNACMSRDNLNVAFQVNYKKNINVAGILTELSSI